MERHFQEKIPFETHSRKSLPHVAILKYFKFFWKKLYFSKKPQILERFENFLYWSRILRQNCYYLVKKIISRSEVNKMAVVGVNAIGKHRVKKTSEIAHLRGRFLLPYF